MNKLISSVIACILIVLQLILQLCSIYNVIVGILVVTSCFIAMIFEYLDEEKQYWWFIIFIIQILIFIGDSNSHYK